jgi:hypothetical protein
MGWIHGDEYFTGAGEDAADHTPAQHSLRQSEIAKEMAIKKLATWKAAKVAKLIGEVPVWYAEAVEAEEYLDMSYQGQYSKEKLERAVLAAGAPSLLAYAKEGERQLTCGQVELNPPADLISAIEVAAHAFSSALKIVKAEAVEADAKKSELAPKLPPSNFNGWLVCVSRETAAKIAIDCKMFAFDGNSQHAVDRMVLSIAQAASLTDNRNKDKMLPSSIFFYDEKTINSIGFGREVTDIKKRCSTLILS